MFTGDSRCFHTSLASFAGPPHGCWRLSPLSRFTRWFTGASNAILPVLIYFTVNLSIIQFWVHSFYFMLSSIFYDELNGNSLISRILIAWLLVLSVAANFAVHSHFTLHSSCALIIHCYIYKFISRQFWFWFIYSLIISEYFSLLKYLKTWLANNLHQNNKTSLSW